MPRTHIILTVEEAIDLYNVLVEAADLAAVKTEDWLGFNCERWASRLQTLMLGGE